jgi:hypothetical protein
MLWAVNQCVPKGGAARTVFASRHGELHRTVPMLRELAQAGELSPAEFSLSVHNAAAGIDGIVRADRSASVSIAAGEETFGYALLEAAVRWRTEPDRPILAVYADEPAPTDYRQFVGVEPPLHVVAVLLSTESSSRVRITRLPSADTAPSQEGMAFSFMRTWMRRRPGAWRGVRAAWSWESVS